MVLARGEAARCAPPMPPDPVGGLGKTSLRLLSTVSRLGILTSPRAWPNGRPEVKGCLRGPERLTALRAATEEPLRGLRAAAAREGQGPGGAGDFRIAGGGCGARMCARTMSRHARPLPSLARA